MPNIHLEDLSLRYRSRWFFDQLSAHFESDHFHCLLGKSGVGKSSLLKLISGILPLEKGVVSDEACHSIQNQVAFMPQSPGLLPWLNVLDNVLVASKLCPDIKADRAKAMALLSQVGLKGSEKLKPNALSGGMAQRVSLVRTLMQDKSIILMDEPFSAVDAVTRHQLQVLAKQMLKDKTVLMVTHDPLEAVQLAECVWLMSGEPASLDLSFTLPKVEQLREMNDALWQQHQSLLAQLEEVHHA